MATRTKRRRRPAPPVQHPQRGQSNVLRRGSWAAIAVGVLGLGALVAALIVTRGDGTSSGNPTAAEIVAGLPDTPDYHSLLVDTRDPRALILGTHQGLFRSSDGGRTWSAADLPGQDAMNLARPTGSTAWAAGHNVLAKSTDGGETWADVRPRGLPSLDVHGFAADPRNPRRLYAAIAGQGLYRSTDGGFSFELASAEVGANVMALAVMPDGRILAGDMEQGLLVSSDGARSWKRVLEAALMGLAVNRQDSRRVLAAGPGVLLSRDGGRNWKQTLDIPDGAGPVAWAPSNPRIAYVVGFDRQLYRTRDGGETWRPVS